MQFFYAIFRDENQGMDNMGGMGMDGQGSGNMMGGIGLGIGGNIHPSHMQPGG